MKKKKKIKGENMKNPQEEKHLEIIRGYLLSGENRYSHDNVAHKQGRCSYPLTSICMAEEHKWKEGIKNLLSNLLSDIERDIITKWNKE